MGAVGSTKIKSILFGAVHNEALQPLPATGARLTSVQSLWEQEMRHAPLPVP